MLNRVGTSTQPCFTPFVTGKRSDSSPPSTAFIMPRIRTECNEFAGSGKFLHDRPQVISADHVERICQIDKGHVEVALLLLAFFLDLTCNEDYVRCSRLGADAAMTLWHVTLFEMLRETVE